MTRSLRSICVVVGVLTFTNGCGTRHYALISALSFSNAFNDHATQLGVKAHIDNLDFLPDEKGNGYTDFPINKVSMLQIHVGQKPNTDVHGVVYYQQDTDDSAAGWEGMMAFYSAVFVFEPTLKIEGVATLVKEILARPSGDGMYSTTGSNVFYYPKKEGNTMQIVITPPGSMYSQYK